MTIDLDTITRENEERKAAREKIQPLSEEIKRALINPNGVLYIDDEKVPVYDHAWEDAEHGAFIVYARTDKAPETIDALVAELKKTRSMLDHATRDWADDDTKIRLLCMRVFSEEHVEGDADRVPDLPDLVEMLVAEVAELRVEIAEHAYTARKK